MNGVVYPQPITETLDAMNETIGTVPKQEALAGYGAGRMHYIERRRGESDMNTSSLLKILMRHLR